MAGTFDISTINVISPNGLVTKSLTVDNYGYAKIGDERVGVTPQNWIINGQFDVWQRGTSQTSSGYGSDDRWSNGQSTSTKTHSKQSFVVGQTEVPNNPTYFSRTVVSTGGTTTSQIHKAQYIEDVTKLAGKTVSVSFWAKADAPKSISIEFTQSFGTGGSSSVESIGIQKFALTTSWQKFTKTVSLPSVSGKTIGTGSYTGIIFWLDAGSGFNARTDSLGNQSGTFDIANVCLVEGSVPVECPNEPYADVLRKCQRYYEICIFSGVARDTTGMTMGTRFTVEKRAIPTVILSGGAMSLIGAGGVSVPNIVFADVRTYGIGFCYYATSVWTAGQMYYGTLLLSAEL